MSLKGSAQPCKLAPYDISTLMPPSMVIHECPNTAFEESCTANCSYCKAAISGTASSTVLTCGSDGATVSDPTFPYPTCSRDTCMVFASEGYEAVLNDTPTSTCAYNSSVNTDWADEVPLCLVVTGDIIASSRVDFSEYFSLTYNETFVVRSSVGDTGAGDRNVTEFVHSSNGHLQGCLECAEALAELFTIRMLVECICTFPMAEGSKLSSHQGSGGQNNFAT